MAKLTPKQERFVQEFLVDLNATAAYRRAGYKDTPVAEHNAARLMGNDKVRAAIEAAMKARNERIQISIDGVVQECLAHYRRCVEAGELAAANKPLELLGRHVGAFPTRHEITGKNGKPPRIRFVRFARSERKDDPTKDAKERE